MDAEEERLRFALLAAAPPGYDHLSMEAVCRAVTDIPDIGDEGVSVRRFAPENFLVVFESQRARDRALRASFVPVGGVRLYFRTWTRLVRARLESLRIRLSLEIEGIPAQAWSMRTAEMILASSCWIERMEPSSENRSDMSAMSLTVWTDKPSRIPKQKTVYIAKHELPVVHGDPELDRIFANVRPYLREKGVLRYETSIHVRSTADFSSRSSSPRPGPSPPSSDGDSGHYGNPDRGYGESRGDRGPRLEGYRCFRGVPDGELPPAAQDGAHAGEHQRGVDGAKTGQSTRPIDTTEQSTLSCDTAPPTPTPAAAPASEVEDRDATEMLLTSATLDVAGPTDPGQSVGCAPSPVGSPLPLGGRRRGGRRHRRQPSLH
ncbi:unnamed protein product [Urochloa humidicola]